MYIVTMNGMKYAQFDTRSKADNYINMQLNKRKGGCESGPPATEKMAHAAKQKWEVIESVIETK
jgi:hypothetical protein